MRQDWTSPDGSPAPEHISAFVDEELGPHDRACVEAWLAGHPEAAAEADSWRRLARLCEVTAAPDPGPASWASTLARIEAGLPARLPVRARGRASRRPFWSATGLAAAAVLAFLLARPVATDLRAPGPGGQGDEPFPVVTGEDVNIVRIDGDDADALVVGHAPMLGDVELVTADDVRVLKVEHDPEAGPMARLDDGQAPVIVPEAPGGWEP